MSNRPQINPLREQLKRLANDDRLDENTRREIKKILDAFDAKNLDRLEELDRNNSEKASSNHALAQASSTPGFVSHNDEKSLFSFGGKLYAGSTPAEFRAIQTAYVSRGEKQAEIELARVNLQRIKAGQAPLVELTPGSI